MCFVFAFLDACTFKGGVKFSKNFLREVAHKGRGGGRWGWGVKVNISGCGWYSGGHYDWTCVNVPNRHLLSQKPAWKCHITMLNLLKVNYKDVVLVSFLLTMNMFHTSSLCFYCGLRLGKYWLQWNTHFILKQLTTGVL